MSVRDGPARERQGQVSDAGASGPDRVSAVRRDGQRPTLLWQDVVEDRQVMWREIPEHVDVGLHQPEVDADGVDVLDVSEVTCHHEVPHALHRRGVAVGVVRHEDQPAVLGGLDQFAPLVQGRSQRLLDHDVLACLECCERDLEMGAGWGGDHHCIHRRIAEHAVQVVGHRHGAVAPDHLRRPCDIEVAHPPQPRLLARLCVADKVRPPVARPDHRNTNGILAHGTPRLVH